MNIDISSGNLVINERRSYYSCLIFGVSSNLYLTDADIIQYSILITNLEMFGLDYWKMFKVKMSHHISQLDHQFIQTVDSNIEWWTRDKKISSVIK